MHGREAAIPTSQRTTSQREETVIVVQSDGAPMSSATSQTAGDTQYNVRHAALLGASSAFSKPPVKPADNGALLAAAQANWRSPSPSNVAARLAAARYSPGDPKPKPKPMPKPKVKPKPRTLSMKATDSTRPPPLLLQRRLSTASTKSHGNESSESASASSYVSAPEQQAQVLEKVRPSRPPPRRPETVYHSHYQRESARQLTKHLTGESLSNAIVGAALAASSRGPSPGALTASPPPLPPPRKHHRHARLHHSRSPSPQKPTGKLRTTLRKEASTSSEEDESAKYKNKGHSIMGMRKKHPNKHHEGTRKRWRDTITERERKRYEGVWAANRGLFIEPPSRSPSREIESDDPALDVLNLVARELWLRSRLPHHALEEVWDLVDGRGIGRLRRHEFVVAMWLIDQRLKGRKLPQRVSDSVWASVRGAGVKVKVKQLHK